MVFPLSYCCLCILALVGLTYSQNFKPSKIVEDPNELFQSSSFFITTDTVSLIVTPYSASHNETTTEVLYDSNLFSSSYQLLTSVTSLSQTVDPLENKIAINIAIKSLRIFGFNVSFSSPLIGSTSMVRISYLTIDYLIRGLQVYLLDYYLGDYQPGLLPALGESNGYLFNFTARYTRSMIIGTDRYVLQPFIKGYQIVNTNGRQFSLGLEATIVNSSFYEIKVKTKSSTQLTITNLYFTLMAYNSSYIQIQNTFYEQFHVEFSPSLLEYSTFGTYHINRENFFVGVQQFTFTTDADVLSFDIDTDFVLEKSMLINMSPQLTTLGVLFIKVQRRSCPDPLFPYFMYTSHRCYEQCPVRFWLDMTLVRCQACSYDCYECVNASSCTKCNSTHYFRQDNIVNGVLRCKPLPGYYNRLWEYAAAKCDASLCVECSGINSNCTECRNNEYLEVTNDIGSCQPCPAECLTCTSLTTCTTCQQFYELNAASECTPICVSNCKTCHAETSPVFKSVCDQCQNGYLLIVSSVPECKLQCGDGFRIQGLEECDDLKTIDGDGCSSQCKVELGYKCYPQNNDQSLPSICYYQQKVNFTLQRLIKSENKNSFTIYLAVSTLNKAILDELIWDRVISINLSQVELIITNEPSPYDRPEQNTIQVSIEVLYTPNISTRSVRIKLNPQINYLQTNRRLIQSPLSIHYNADQPLPNIQYNLNPTIVSSTPNLIKFTTTPITEHEFTLKSDNHLAIIFQSNDLFFISNLLSYLFIALDVLVILLFFSSMTVYGGKIITLQLVFLLNCAYFSLLGFDQLQIFSTLTALSSLRLVTLNFNPISYSKNNPLWWTGITPLFINSCLIPIIVLVIPPIISLVSYIVTKKANTTQTIKAALFIQKYSLGQLFMTAYLFSAYTFTVNMTLTIFHLISGSSNDIVGMIAGILLLVMGIVLFIMLIKKRACFWQFIQSFYKSTLAEYYMNLSTIMIWINSICLVAMSHTAYGNIVPILLSLIWICFLLKKKPFRLGSQNRRPIVIQIINMLIQGVMMVIKLRLTDSESLHQMPAIYHFLPITVFVLLLIAFIYTTYCLYHRIKEAHQDRKQYLQNQGLVTNNVKIDSKNTTSKEIQNTTHKDINNESLDSQTQKDKDIDYKKEIISELKKQKGFNFLSLALSIDKKQLDQNWQCFQKVNTSNPPTQSPDRIKRPIDLSLLRSPFYETHKLKDYFKFSVKNTQPDKVLYQSKKSQTPREQNKIQSCLNCGQKVQTYSNRQQLIPKFYQSEKHKEEWKNFFKPKQPIQSDKLHSLAEYDMI